MKKPLRIWDVLTLLAVLAGVGARFFAGWTVRHLPWRDSAVVMLMSRHISEGNTPSVFYYGQAYMGSLEAWVSAQCMRLFGDSAFAACLGTVLLGCAVLVVTVAMARSVAGPRAAFFTALLMLTASDAALYLSSHPRGGYMVMLLSGLGTLGFGWRYLRAVAEHREPRFAWSLVLAGLCAGIGWWNLQLVVVYVLPAVLLAIPAVPRLLRQRALLPAILAFFIGGLPWWWWNVTHDWASLSMTHGVGGVQFGYGARLFVHRLIDMLGYKGVASPWFELRVLAALSVAGAALLMLMRTFFHKRDPAQQALRGLLPHLLVLVSVFLVYATSHFARFNTSRYLLPFFPSFAIVAGVGLHILAGRQTVRLAGVCGLVLLVMPVDTWALHLWSKNLAEHDPVWRRAAELAVYLEREADGMAMGHPMKSWITVAGRERGRIIDFPYDVYAPYNRRMGEAGIKAVHGNYLDAAGFLQSTGVGYQRKSVSGHDLVMGFEAPTVSWTRVRASQVKIPRGAEGEPAVLQDDNLDTRVVLRRGTRQPVLSFNFDTPEQINGLLIPHAREWGLDTLTLVGRDAEGSERLLLENVPVFEYFWSGSKLLRGGVGHYRMLRFEAPESGWSELEIQLIDPVEGESPRRELSEVMWLRQETADKVTLDVSAVLKDFDQGVLLAPRWLREEWQTEVPPEVDLRLPDFWTRGVNDLAEEESRHPEQLPAGVPLRLVLPEWCRERSLRLLEEAGLQGHVISEEPWTIVDVENPADTLDEWLPLYWTEFGVFASTGVEWRRFERALDLVERSQGKVENRAELLARARKLVPEIAGVGEEAGSPSLAGFAHGPQLVEITSSCTDTPPLLQLSWRWRVPANFDMINWAVFVHFLQDGRILFQDDYNPMQALPPEVISRAPVDRYVAVTRHVPIPAQVDGTLTLRTGCLDPSTGKRIPVRSAYRTEKGTVEIPGVRIEPGTVVLRASGE